MDAAPCIPSIIPFSPDPFSVSLALLSLLSPLGKRITLVLKRAKRGLMAREEGCSKLRYRGLATLPNQPPPSLIPPSPLAALHLPTAAHPPLPPLPKTTRSTQWLEGLDPPTNDSTRLFNIKYSTTPQSVDSHYHLSNIHLWTYFSNYINIIYLNLAWNTSESHAFRTDSRKDINFLADADVKRLHRRS